MPAQPVEITRLVQALEQFEARQPRDLPQGVVEKLGEVRQMLNEVTPSRDTPGMQEAMKLSKHMDGASATGESGTGMPFSQAATGADAPSPGQREALNLTEGLKQAAQDFLERVNNGRSGTETPSGETARPS